MRLTIVPPKPHLELVPLHVIAPGGVSGSLTVCPHVMDSTGGSLGVGNPILVAEVGYLAQPIRAIGPRGVVGPNVPGFDDGQDSLMGEEVFFKISLVIGWRVPIAVVTANRLSSLV